MATKKKAKAAVQLKPKLTAAEKRKQRAAEIKRRNEERLKRLAKLKEERRAAKREAAAEPDPAKVAKAEAKKAEREAKEKAIAEATKALGPIAKEVNVRLEKAAKMEKDADDHRLAAALQLKEAEERCKAAGIPFKKWSEENVKGQSYETVRKLLAVGKAPEPALALADMRAKNAAANKRLREKQRAEREGRQAPQQPSSSEARERPQPEEEVLEGLDALKTAFGELKASEQMEFVEWAANEVGARLDTTI